MSWNASGLAAHHYNFGCRDNRLISYCSKRPIGLALWNGLRTATIVSTVGLALDVVAFFPSSPSSFAMQIPFHGMNWILAVLYASDFMEAPIALMLWMCTNMLAPSRISQNLIIFGISCNIESGRSSREALRKCSASIYLLTYLLTYLFGPWGLREKDGLDLDLLPSQSLFVNLMKFHDLNWGNLLYCVLERPQGHTGPDHLQHGCCSGCDLAKAAVRGLWQGATVRPLQGAGGSAYRDMSDRMVEAQTNPISNQLNFKPATFQISSISQPLRTGSLWLETSAAALRGRFENAKTKYT